MRGDNIGLPGKEAQEEPGPLTLGGIDALDDLLKNLPLVTTIAWRRHKYANLTHGPKSHILLQFCGKR